MAITVWEYGSSPAIGGQAGTHVQIVAGTPITTAEEFKDDLGVPLIALAGYPQVVVKEGSSVITSGIAYTKQPNSGEWVCDLTIPSDFDFGGESEKILSVTWLFKDINNNQYKNSLLISVMPLDIVNTDQTSEIIKLVPFNSVSIVVPYIISSTDIAQLSMYDGNMLKSANISAVTRTKSGQSTILEFPLNIPMNGARLNPYNLIINVVVSGAVRQMFTQLYPINPSMLSAMQSLDTAINKANQLETIPGLRFRELDLMQGLLRGLDYFNSIGVTPSSFNGEDMQGPIREAWLICASIRVLRAQLQAEGWFNFDFTGQNVSLNVDRTQALSDALSFYEGQIDSTVKPLKFQLARKGVISGSGAQGANLNTYSQMGLTTLSNNPVTRGRYMGLYIRQS
jgi:hypothetical protein